MGHWGFGGLGLGDERMGDLAMWFWVVHVLNP